MKSFSLFVVISLDHGQAKKKGNEHLEKTHTCVMCDGQTNFSKKIQKFNQTTTKYYCVCVFFDNKKNFVFFFWNEKTPKTQRKHCNKHQQKKENPRQKTFDVLKGILHITKNEKHSVASQNDQFNRLIWKKLLGKVVWKNFPAKKII